MRTGLGDQRQFACDEVFLEDTLVQRHIARGNASVIGRISGVESGFLQRRFLQ